MKHIAVIGSGIAGLGAAYLLSRRHLVSLFERESRFGGHTHTVTVDSSTGPVALDTGFLVHNDRTYPNLVRLFDEIGIETDTSDMSFSVSGGSDGFEYSSRGARGFFARRLSVLSPSHIGLLRDIARFNRAAPCVLSRPDAAAITLGDFLDEERFGETFSRRYLMPMAAAIWSSSPGAIRSFPALTMVRFLDNHGLLAASGQPRWKVVRGGSHRYIPRLTETLEDRVHRSVSIRNVMRTETGVVISFHDRPSRTFDEVVFACHGDQVLPLLANPTDRERDVFRHFATTTNVAWLHTDVSVLPSRPAARASWNYHVGGAERAGRAGGSGRAGRDGDAHDEGPPTVTYHLNRLQALSCREQFCVTLNPGGLVDDRAVLRRMVYAHPLYTREAIAAQARWQEVSGVNRTHYCGAYWAYGFHEDGLNSALRVAATLGVTW